MRFTIISAFITALCLTSLDTYSQVHWKYSSQKLSDRIFEIHITAVIENGWHLYSQSQPPEAIATPSRLKFDENTALQFTGAVKEIGSRELYENKEVGIKSYQYKSYVDFVQIIKLKSTAKTNVNGSISFMACTDEQCLPPQTQQFSIPIK